MIFAFEGINNNFSIRPKTCVAARSAYAITDIKGMIVFAEFTPIILLTAFFSDEEVDQRKIDLSASTVS